MCSLTKTNILLIPHHCNRAYQLQHLLYFYLVHAKKYKFWDTTKEQQAVCQISWPFKCRIQKLLVFVMLRYAQMSNLQKWNFVLSAVLTLIIITENASFYKVFWAIYTNDILIVEFHILYCIMFPLENNRYGTT